MITVRPPARAEVDETRRLAVLRSLNLLDTSPEQAFEDIVALAKGMLKASSALVSLVDERRQWFKAKLGFELPETPRCYAFCHHTIAQRGVMWIADARLDPRFVDSPLVTGPPGVRFYAGAPLIVRGQPIGALCVTARRPRAFDARQARKLSRLANLTSNECEHRLSILEIDAARRAAAGASQAKSQFLANMSHELRTPLNGVIGVASVLERSVTGSAQQEMVGIIRKSGETLTALLDDILDISKIEAGRFELELHAFSLHDVLQQAVDLYRHRAEDKGVRLSLSCETRASFLGDGPRIRQIVNNLISNAVKFTDAGEVRVTVNEALESGGSALAIEVADTGPGFTAEAARRLFDRFEQGDGSLTRRHGGTGLGLAISRALAELMGGTLTAASTPGQGAQFTLRLDLQTASEPESTDGCVDPRGSDDGAPAVRVLVADDNATNRRVVELILGAVGAKVTSVEDGLQAVDAFASTPFDYVLMDVQMPVMDGLEAIRRIRALERAEGRPSTPIHTLSAHAMSEHIRDAIEAGADDHLTQPISSERLLQALVQAIDRAPAAA